MKIAEKSNFLYLQSPLKDVARRGSENGNPEAALAVGGQKERTERLRHDGEAAGGDGCSGGSDGVLE